MNWLHNFPRGVRSNPNFGERIFDTRKSGLPVAIPLLLAAVGWLGFDSEDSDPLATMDRALLALVSMLAGAMGTALVLRSRHRKFQLEQSLTEKRTHSMVSSAMDGIITIHADGTIDSFNPAAETIFGYSRNEVIGQNITLLMPEPYGKEHGGYLQHYLTTGVSKIMGIAREVPALRKDGSAFDMEVSVSPMDLDEKIFFIGIVRDTTERKQAEIKLLKAREELETRIRKRTTDLAAANRKLTEEISERKKAQHQLTTSLREKETLLKEVHHRTKNNLQIISSLFGLESNKVNDSRYEEMFRENHNRIKSMALVHDKILQSGSANQADSGEYMRNLALDLLQSYGLPRDQVDLKIQTDGTLMGLDTGIYCGLIINELVSNSLKYAFPDGEKGQILLSYRKKTENSLELIVKDDGRGLPPGFDYRNNSSLGLQLVTSLAEEQLEGTIDVQSKCGTEFKIVFPGGSR